MVSLATSGQGWDQLRPRHTALHGAPLSVPHLGSSGNARLAVCEEPGLAPPLVLGVLFPYRHKTFGNFIPHVFYERRWGFMKDPHPL